MSVALHGNLRDFGIAEVFQLIGQQRKTGTLVVEGEEGAIFLAFDGGRVFRGGPVGARAEREPLASQLVRSGYLTRRQIEEIQIESERSARPVSDLLLATGLIDPGTLDEVQHVLTKDAVFDVVRRKSGDFEFVAEPVVHDTPAENLLGAEQILMDGLRMLDEWQTFAAIVPGEDAVFRRVGDLSVVRATTRSGADVRQGHSERIAQLVDGRLSVRRIIDLSRIGTFEATRALVELRQAGVIDVTSPSRSKVRSRRRAGRRLAVLPFLRAAFATALPFVLLGFLGALIVEPAGDTRGGLGSAIPLRALEHFGARYEKDLIRQQLEAHFFELGRYPERLDAIAHRMASLTAERLADYYYVVRNDEVVLLAPAD